MALRVLLIDDNAERAAAVSAGLEADGCVVVGDEVGEGFEAELPHVVGGGARFVVEDEFVGGGVEGEGEAADDVEGGLGFALLVAADLGDVEFDVVGELLLGECVVCGW